MSSINELRKWATETFGAHSHKETQILAALGPLEEWLSHLARHGVALELRPVGVADFLPKPETSGPASGYVTGPDAGEDVAPDAPITTVDNFIVPVAPESPVVPEDHHE